MSQRTLLQSIQSRCRLIGIPVPTSAIASTDKTVQQLVEIANEEVKDHCNREYEFKKLQSFCTFAYGPATPPYNAFNLETGSGIFGYRSMIPDTFWNSTTRLPVNGPVSDDVWRQMLVMLMSAAVDNYRVNGDFLQIYSTLSTSNNYVFEYLSNFGVVDTLGTTTKELFTVDTDLPRLPSRIFELGLLWRWRQLKGQSYAQEFEMYENMLREEARNEPTSQTLRMDFGPGNLTAGPGLLVAAGSWNLP